MATQLLFATGNQNKVDEVMDLLPPSIQIKSLKDIGFTQDIPETQLTIEGNAKQKAEYMLQRGYSFVFAEDTGLEIEALDGEPGVRSARYAGEQKNNEANIELVLSKLEHHTNRAARFKTVIALYFNGNYHEFEGILNGTIHTEKKGKYGFGYDSIFIPHQSTKTLAEYSKNEKNAISHRGKAINKLVEFLQENA